MSRWVVLLTGVAILALVNVSIFQREQLLREGRVVLLELAPVDPRSLMQGDYMALRFRLADQIPESAQDGVAVVGVDDHAVAAFRRLDTGGPLSPDEARIRFRVREGRKKLGTDAFFFQEGRAVDYSGARYGEARVADDGTMLLTGLRDPDYRKLGQR